MLSPKWSGLLTGITFCVGVCQKKRLKAKGRRTEHIISRRRHQQKDNTQITPATNTTYLVSSVSLLSSDEFVDFVDSGLRFTTTTWALVLAWWGSGGNDRDREMRDDTKLEDAPKVQRCRSPDSTQSTSWTRA